MGSEQQFCLRWNNHQSTLISVFDTLLESETLVDVTLAAEGQYLKAHKVVLSACSQYFQELLCHHIEKHPIIILKDVTFQELKALIDYMYRGEVNVSQEQLSALIKTAESLKIKGLADGGDRRPDRKSVPQLSPPLPPVLAPALSGNLSLDSRSMGAGEYATNSPLQHAPREGSISPVSRKRKRIRRRSGDGVGGGGTHEGEVGGGSEQASSSASTISVPNIPATITPVNSGSRTTPGDGDGVDDDGVSGSKAEGGPEDGAQGPASSKQTKSEPGTSLQSHSQTPLLEPKSEYREEDDDDGEADEDSMDNVVALDEDVMDMEGSRDDGLDQKPGPSHGAEVSGQGSGFAPWHMMPDRSGDDIFIPSQEAAAQRESQEPLWEPPQSSSPMCLKIASVQSGNLSDWLGVMEPEEASSSSSFSQDRGINESEARHTRYSLPVNSASLRGVRMGRRSFFTRKSIANSVGYINSPLSRGVSLLRGRPSIRRNMGEPRKLQIRDLSPIASPPLPPGTVRSYPLCLQPGVPVAGKRPRGRPPKSGRCPGFVSVGGVPVNLEFKRPRGRPRGSGRGRVITQSQGIPAKLDVKSSSAPLNVSLPGLTNQGDLVVRRPRGRPRGSGHSRSLSMIDCISIVNIKPSAEVGTGLNDLCTTRPQRRRYPPKHACHAKCFELEKTI